MKVYSIAVLKKEKQASLLAQSKDVTSFGYFERGAVGEFLSFFSRTLVERTNPATRQSVEEQVYHCHVHVRADGLAGVVIADAEYPLRVAFTLISKVLDDFQKRFGPESWTGNPRDTPFPELEATLAKYQNPHEADSLLKVQKDLDETKIILHRNMEALLERGEKIDDLVSRSDELSSASKMFYRQAKKVNSCCVVM